jgi:hypothetical protein
MDPLGAGKLKTSLKGAILTKPKTFWVKKGHLLCSSCLDEIEKKQKDLKS